VFLKLRDAREFISQANQASKAVKGVGDEAEQTGKKSRTSWGSLAQWAGGAAAMYGATRFIKGAVGATEDLAKSSIALSRTTGMDVSTASQWASVARERGISTQQLQVGLVKLSREMDSASTGSKAAIKVWDRLGISMKEVRSGNTQQVLMDTADALKRIQNPAERAALTQTLFGRTGQRLLPIIAGGSKGIREQLGVVKEYGDYLGVHTVGQLRQLLARQREMGAAFQGVKIQLGMALLPILLTLSKLLLDILKVIQPLTQNATALRIVVFSLAAAFVAYQTAMTVAIVAENLFNVTLTATEVLITGGVVLAIIALIAAVYLLIHHWKWVKEVAMDVWHWIARNWPLLVGIAFGPVAFAIVELVKHFGAVKRVAKEVVDWVIHQFERLVGFFKHLPGRVFHGATGLLHRAGSGLVHGLTHPFGLQTGGTLTTPGTVVVGEKGPELLNLPAGANVIPLPSQLANINATGAFGSAQITTQVVLDRRVLAEAVATFTADQLARR
jgi:hypothetical protein